MITLNEAGSELLQTIAKMDWEKGPILTLSPSSGTQELRDAKLLELHIVPDKWRLTSVGEIAVRKVTLQA